MRKSKVVVLVFAAALLGTGLSQPAAFAAKRLTPEYLDGLWSLEGSARCGAENVEYVLFEKDGTFKTGRLDHVETVGFWRIEGDQLNLHMVGSLALFSERVEDVEGRFQYFNMRALADDIEKDSLSGVASFGADLERFTAARCPMTEDRKG